MRLVFLISSCMITGTLFSQVRDSAIQYAGDTALQEVTVQAFNTRLQWKAVPAAVAIVTPKEMNRYAGLSLVPVFNTVPGVRMEERSPDSYR